MQEQSRSLTVSISRHVSLNYLLFLPTGYDADPEARFPLILFLHGTGERGNELSYLKKTGLPAKLENWPDCPFIVVAPQCSTDSIWTLELDALNALLDSVCASLRVDQRRMYLTGLSLGGNGTWYLATAYPGRFAAIAPICGRGISRSVPHRLKNIPIWAFHGALDTVVPVSETERMVESLRDAGCDVRMTIYPDLKHDSWTRTYDDPDLYRWFLSHVRPE